MQTLLAQPGSVQHPTLLSAVYIAVLRGLSCMTYVQTPSVTMTSPAWGDCWVYIRIIYIILYSSTNDTREDAYKVHDGLIAQSCVLPSMASYHIVCMYAKYEYDY